MRRLARMKTSTIIHCATEMVIVEDVCNMIRLCSSIEFPAAIYTKQHLKCKIEATLV